MEKSDTHVEVAQPVGAVPPKPKTEDGTGWTEKSSKESSDGGESEILLVKFKTPHDDDNPLDWTTNRKWTVTHVLSATGFNRIMVSTIVAPALTTIAAELDMNATESAMSLSIYLLATAVGPLFIGPLSEVYGREVVLHGSNIWFFLWNLLCGFSHTKGLLIASRFFAGLGASAIYALGGGVLGDIWRPQHRGRSLSLYLLVPLLGAAVGPIIGGFITERTTWRWMFWSTSAFQALMVAASFLFFRETYGPVILHRRAKALRRDESELRYYTEGEKRNAEMYLSSILLQALTRPLRLLLNHPIIQVTAVLSAFNYGIMYIVLSTFSNLWIEVYGQSIEISGLHYIAFAIGEIGGSQFGGRLMDRLYKTRMKTNEKVPEDRLPLMFPGTWLAWAGMLAYGWTAAYRVQWAVVDVCVMFMMIGMQLGGMPMTAYVIDTYGEHTSSALAAQQFLRSLAAFLFPLFAPSMYYRLGYGWTNTTLSLMGLCLGTPIILFFWKFGARLRAKATSSH